MCWGLRGEVWGLSALLLEWVTGMPGMSFIAAVPLRTGEGDHPQDGGVALAVSPNEAEAGIAEMNRVYDGAGRGPWA